MNNKVYLVTSGDYYDYRVAAVFSTKKLAKKWINLQSYPTDYGIDDWLVDAEAKAQRIVIWTCTIFLDTGDIIESRSHECVQVPFHGKVMQSAIRPSFYGGRMISRVSSGVSQEHCIKIAVEERQRWLREKTEAAR